MSRRLPDFLIIGAMKCATTTLHEQLARIPGFAMSWPKEPNFFSDDAIYERGLDWYSALFDNAPAGSLLGESSTHYTKLPHYPKAVDRIAKHLPDVKLVYIMRHPVDRLVSHYWHDFLDGRIQSRIDDAVREHTNLIDFGRYAFQLKPYLEAFGSNRIHPIFFERLVADPQAELDRLCLFLGLDHPAAWDFELEPQNVGIERMRQSRLRQAVVNDPILGPLRRLLVPKPLSNRLKDFWRVRQARPKLSEASLALLQEVFDPDLAILGSWLSVELNCANFVEVAKRKPAVWAENRLSSDHYAGCSAS